MKRRLFLQMSSAALAGALATRVSAQSSAPAPSSAIGKVEKTPAEWRKVLTPEQFHILREEGTEWAGTSPLNKEKRNGSYACVGCDLVLLHQCYFCFFQYFCGFTGELSRCSF